MEHLIRDNELAKLASYSPAKTKATKVQTLRSHEASLPFCETFAKDATTTGVSPRETPLEDGERKRAQNLPVLPLFIYLSI